jgi:hypothetical protein
MGRAGHAFNFDSFLGTGLCPVPRGSTTTIGSRRKSP